MIYLAIYFVVMLGAWFMGHTYHDALLNAYISISVLLAALLDRSRNTGLFYRTLLAAIFIDSLVDCAVLAGWIAGYGNAAPISLVIFLFIMTYLIGRDYDTIGHLFNPNQICILLLRPRNTFEVIKSFFGFPVASICIAANGFVWSYRHKTGRFEKMAYSRTLAASHIIIDTGIKPTEPILQSLNAMIGAKRGIGYKCVWGIRHTLSLMGYEFAPTWFAYIPGIYASRLLRFLKRKG